MWSKPIAAPPRIRIPPKPPHHKTPANHRRAIPWLANSRSQVDDLTKAQLEAVRQAQTELTKVFDTVYNMYDDPAERGREHARRSTSDPDSLY